MDDVVNGKSLMLQATPASLTTSLQYSMHTSPQAIAMWNGEIDTSQITICHPKNSGAENPKHGSRLCCQYLIN